MSLAESGNERPLKRPRALAKKRRSQAERTRDTQKRILDAASAVGLAGVLAATVMVTVPITQELENEAPRDYPHERAQSLTKNWSRAHKVRTSLGIGAFVCAVASNLTTSRDGSR